MPESPAIKMSFEKISLEYAQTGFFGSSVLDYISDDEKLKPFYHRRPSLDSFGAQLKEKEEVYEHRETLVSALREQYKKSGLKAQHINRLENPKSFTVTTGHQVCLFTGPLYFFYKIVSVINTCEKLKNEHPEYDFVPIFWMATEDHDFAEANHFFLPNGKIEWESGQGGAVGRMTMEGIDDVLVELKDKLGIGYRSGEVLEIFKRAYLKQHCVADAMRYLVHHLFGDYGVISLDGDDPALKSAMIPYFERELLENPSYQAMSATNKRLGEDYSLQVTPREINLFYLGNQLRERIVKDEEGTFEVLNSSIGFTEAELREELHNHPERFSPNVVLRPLYQEVILPNLAYIGGGGELNYWFQLQAVFEAFDVSFPILMLRNSVMVIDKESSKLMGKLGLTIQELFQNSAFELEQELVRETSDEELNLQEFHEKLEHLFLEIEHKLKRVNDQLEKSVRSGYVRSERIVKNLEKKMLRAEKKKHEILIDRLHRLRENLFPREGLQERNLNFVTFYEEVGSDLVPLLIDQLDPFSGEFTVLRVKL